MQRRIAIVEDCAATRTVLVAHCSKHGYRTVEFANGQAFANVVKSAIDFDAVLLDIELGDIDGYEVLARIRERGSRPPVIVVTANNEAASVVRCLRLGADDYITKPLDFVRLETSLNAVIRHGEVTRKLEQASRQLRAIEGNTGLIARSPAMQRTLALVDRARNSDVTVLLLGESGVGKEVIARSLHFDGPRRDQPFVAINCAAIPPSLLESEMFGHEAGAFTGASHAHPGKFEQAGAGTIFLDEIGDMPLAAQASLLRVLEARTLCRVGGSGEIPVKARVICATHRKLRQHTQEGHFREDLYYRISVFPVSIPPLRERREDIPALIAALSRHHGETRNQPLHFDADCLELLEHYPWPGNVRELHHVIERAALLVDDGKIEVRHLPEELQSWGEEVASLRKHPNDTGKVSHIAFADAADIVPFWRVEQAVLTGALKACNGDVVAAAERLHISRGTIYRRLKTWDIDADSFRVSADQHAT